SPTRATLQLRCGIIVHRLGARSILGHGSQCRTTPTWSDTITPTERIVEPTAMQSQPFIDRLMADIQRRLPGDPGQLRDDVEHSIRAVLGEALARLDLISREEFDVQQRVLERTREK